MGFNAQQASSSVIWAGGNGIKATVSIFGQTICGLKGADAGADSGSGAEPAKWTGRISQLSRESSVRSGWGMLIITTGGGADADGIGSASVDALIRGPFLFTLADKAGLALRAATLVRCFLRGIFSSYL